MKTLFRIAIALLLGIAALPAQAQQTLTLCAGSGSVMLTAINSQSLSNPSYSMNPGGTAFLNATLAVSPASSVVYTMYVTGTTGSSSVAVTTINTITVQVSNPPNANLNPASQTVSCGPGLTGTITNVAGSSNVKHNWYSPAMPTPFSTNGQVSNFVMSVMSGSNTTYTCVVVDNLTGCSSSQTAQIVSSGGAYPSFSLTSLQNFNIGCASYSVASINIAGGQASGGGIVSYTVLPPGYLGGLSYLTSSVSTYTMNTPGTYTVIVRDPINNCETRLPVAILQNTAIPAIATSAPAYTLNCDMPVVALTGSSSGSASGPLSFSWFYLDGPSTTQVNSPSIAVNVHTATAFTSSVINIYTLTVLNQNTGCGNSTVVTMWQNIRPPNAAINTPIVLCQNSAVLVNISSSGILPNTFFISQPVVAQLWQGPSPQATLAMSTTYTALASGVYTMTVKDMNNGCISSATTNVSVGFNAAFAHTITGGQAVFNSVSTGITPTTLYYWEFGDGSYTMQQNPTHTYLNGGAHLVKFKVTDTGSVCADSVMQSVTISGAPCLANSNFSMAPTATAQIWNAMPSYPWNVTAATWDWGDGSSSNTLFTTHQYSAPAMYNICLSVTVSCAASSSTCTSYSVFRSSQQAMVLWVNVVAPELISGLAAAEAEGQLSWSIVPNPNAGEFQLALGAAIFEPVWVQISDLTGRIVHEQLMGLELSSMPVRTHQLPLGMYLVTLGSGERKATKRMILSH